MELYNFFFCMTVCMTAKVHFGDCRFCSTSVKTAREVTSCPTEISQVLEASKRLKCDKLALTQNCTSASKFKYHCVMNVFENATLEVCAPEWIISGYCAEFNTEGGRIQAHYAMKCIGCPPRYKSSDSFKYDFCYKMIKNNQEKMVNVSTAGNMTNVTPSDKSSSKSKGWIIWTIVAIVLTILTGVVLLSRKIIRKRSSQRKLPKDNEDEQGNPLLDPHACGRNKETVEIEIKDDEVELKRRDLEFKRKRTLQRLRVVFRQELEKLKTGIDVIKGTPNFIDAKECDDNEEESNEEELLYERSTDEINESEFGNSAEVTSNEPHQQPPAVEQPLKESSKNWLQSGQKPECVETDLFSLLSLLFSDKWKSAAEVRKDTVSFEKKHKQYFMLFRIKNFPYEKSLLKKFNKNLDNLVKVKEGPTLREIYAASEILHRKILLFKYILGKRRAILISPIIFGVQDETSPIELEMKLSSEGEPTFRCLNLDRETIEIDSEEMFEIINDGHDFCFDKRFRNCFDLLHSGNYFCSYISTQSSESKSIFQVLGKLIYGNSLEEDDSANIIKECLTEHYKGNEIKKTYSKFTDIQSYASEKDMKKYDSHMNAKDKERLQEKAFKKHLQEWKFITEGDLFALSSILGITLNVLENENDNESWQIFRPIDSEMTQTFEGSFNIIRQTKNHFDVFESRNISCPCQFERPMVMGKITAAEKEIREHIQKELSYSRNVCCKSRDGRKIHTHLNAVQTACLQNCNGSCWTRKRKKPPTEFSKPLSEEQRTAQIVLVENFRKIQQTDESLENALCKELYDLQNEHLIAKLTKKLKSSGKKISSKIQRATDYIGVPIFIFKMANNYCRWIKFQPIEKRTSPDCRFYITLLLHVDGVRDYVRFDRIIPLEGCNCMLNPPDTPSYLDNDNRKEELKIPKEKRHSPLIYLFHASQNKLLSNLFEDEERYISKFPSKADESEAGQILSNSNMSKRTIDPVKYSDSPYRRSSDVSKGTLNPVVNYDSLYRCTSKDIFGTEENFAIIENLINRRAALMSYNPCDTAEQNSIEFGTEVNFPPRVAYILSVLASVFECSIYVITGQIQDQDFISVWEEFKSDSNKKYESNVEKCKDFYFTFFYSTEGNFYRVVGKNHEDICNCLLDRPQIRVKEKIQKNEKDKKIEFRRDSTRSIMKNVRHPFEIHIPLDEFIEEEVRHVPLFSCTTEKSLLTSQNMASRIIDPVSDISFSFCRCLSKEVFGTEAHFEMVKGLLLHEIELNKSIYKSLFDNELRFAPEDKDIEDPISLCISLITDGLQMPDLQLQAAADTFQCSIYVIKIVDDNGKYWSEWKEITPKIQKWKGIPRKVQCERPYYITLYQAFTGVFHRAVPVEYICNCSLDPPNESIKEKINSDISIISLRAEQQLLKTKAVLDNWLRYNTVLELLLMSLIEEFENRRKGVNIATITGSSIGVIGAILTGIGIVGAPATAGISLGLTTAGDVISAAGAMTSIGAKIAEMGLSRKNYKTIKNNTIQMHIFSKQLEDNMNKLFETSKLLRNDDEQNEPIVSKLHENAPFMRAVLGAGLVPLVVLRVLARAIVEAESVFLPLAFIVDVALAVLAAKSLKYGSVTSHSLKLRASKHHLRLTRQQMLTWAFGSGE